MLEELNDQLCNVFEVTKEKWHSKRAFTITNGKYYLNKNSGTSEYISDNGNIILSKTIGIDYHTQEKVEIEADTIVKLQKMDAVSKAGPLYGPLELIGRDKYAPVNFENRIVLVDITAIKKSRTKTQSRVNTGDKAQVSISSALTTKFPGIKITSVAKRGSNGGDIRFTFNGKEGTIEVKGTTKVSANVTFFDKTYFFEEYRKYLKGEEVERTATIDNLIDAHASYKKALPDKSVLGNSLNLIKVIESFRKSGNKEIGFSAQPGVKFASGIIPISWFAEHADPTIYKTVLQNKMAEDNYFCLIDTSTKTAYLWFNESSGQDVLGLGNTFPEINKCKLKTYRNQGPERLSVGFNCRIEATSNKPVIIPL